MTKDNSQATRSRWTQGRAIALSLLLVASMVAMPLLFTGGLPGVESDHPGSALAQTSDENESYYDDFEDENYDDWTPDDPDNLEISNDSFYGNYSLHTTPTSSGDAGATWTDGPTFDLGDNFEISGTHKPIVEGATGDVAVLGISNPEEEKVASIYHHKDGYTYLQTGYDQPTPDSDERIGKNFDSTWADFRYQVDNGVARVKVWEAGTEEPEEWQLEREFDQFEGQFYIGAGGDGTEREIYLDQVDAGGNAISGQVVDQSGEPVPNATVEGMGVNTGSINDSIEDKQAEAEELLAEAQEVGTPDSWDSQFDLEGHYQDADTTYLLAHGKSEWDTQTQSIVDDPQLGRPKLKFDSDEEVVLSMWDPTGSSGLLPNQIDGSFPGTTSDGEIVIEQYSATGEVTDRQTRETETIAESSGSNIVGTNEYPGVETSLSTGFYKVYPEGNEAAGYVIQVGDAEDQLDRLESNLEDEQGELTESARQLQENVESGLFERQTVTADENGYYTLRMQTGVQTASVQAYRADGTVLPAITGPSFSDLRNAAESGDYEGTYHIGAPFQNDVPAENVTVETYRTDQLPMQGIESYEDLQDFLRDQRMNETVSEIQSEYDEQFSEMNRSRLEASYATHRPLVETVPGAEDRYLERSDFEEIQDRDDLSADELATETGHMQTALANVDSFEPPDPGDTAIDIEDGELNAEYPIPSGIDEDTLQPEIHWSDGSSEEISDEYWSIDEGDFGGQDTLTVSGLPIDTDDPAAFDLRIMGGGSGGMLDDRLSATNPSFSGSVPDVRAIDMSTTAPGDNERVSMTFRPGDDSSFESVESVDVVGPDGQQIDASVSGGDRASFTTDGAGEHFIRATVTDTTGSQFVQSFSVRALEQGRSDPPTVRAEKATGDRVFAVVGEGLDDAEIRTDGDALEVDAVVPGGEIPGSVHVKPQAAMDGDETDLEVQVLEGSDEATVSSNIETVVHLDSIPEDSRVWRGEPGWLGQALERDGGTRYGEVMTRADGDKTVIRTYTDGNGNSQITIDSRDGFTGMYDGFRHGFASSVPRFNLPFGLGMAVPTAGGATIAGVGLVISRRRYGFW